MADLSHFDKLDPAMGQLARDIYDLVLSVEPDLHRMKRWGFPGFVGNSTILTVCGHLNHINLQFFYGAHLTNINDLLEGTGKDLRHIKFRDPSDLARDGVKQIIRAAIKHDFRLPDEGLRARAEK